MFIKEHKILTNAFSWVPPDKRIYPALDSLLPRKLLGFDFVMNREGARKELIEQMITAHRARELAVA